MCKVYTGYCGTSKIVHGLCACRLIIPSLKLGDYLSVQAHKPCSISHIDISDKEPEEVLKSHFIFIQVEAAVKRLVGWLFLGLTAL